MEKLIIIMSICSFLMGLFWSIAKLSGPPFQCAVMRIIGILGLALPLIFWLKIWEII